MSIVIASVPHLAKNLDFRRSVVLRPRYLRVSIWFVAAVPTLRNSSDNHFNDIRCYEDLEGIL